jgi:hypothetical protein
VSKWAAEEEAAQMLYALRSNVSWLSRGVFDKEEKKQQLARNRIWSDCK